MRVTPFSYEHDSILNVSLDPAEHYQLREAAAGLYPVIADMSEGDGLAAIHRWAAEADLNRLRGLRDFLGEFFSRQSEVKVVLLNGPWPDPADMPMTPKRYLAPDQNPAMPHDLYRDIVIGNAAPQLHPYAFTSQQFGTVRNNVVFIPEHSHTSGISANATEKLDFHVEDASYNHSREEDGLDRNLSPGWLTLHFLRNPARGLPGGIPTILSAPSLGELSAEDYAELSQPFFHNHTNAGQGGDRNVHLAPVSVVYADDREWLRLNMAAALDYEQYTPAQQLALHNLVQLVLNNSVDVPAAPGNIVLIDNRKVLHGRALPKPGQEPQYDGLDRWQRRVVYADDFRAIEPYLANPDNRFVADPDKLFEQLQSEQAQAA